jgi:hypothetical protein
MPTLNLCLKINVSSETGPYSVEGLPLDQFAIIMRIHGRWKLLRTIDDVSGGWTGSFDSAERHWQH